MSWLVAPQCTQFAASPPTWVRERPYERLDRVPREAALDGEHRASRSPDRTPRRSTAAASAGTIPTLASALASARSASSIPCSHARSETASRRRSGTRSTSKASHREEHRLAGALEPDVEPERAAPRPRAISVSRQPGRAPTGPDRPRSPPPRPGSTCG